MSFFELGSFLENIVVSSSDSASKGVRQITLRLDLLIPGNTDSIACTPINTILFISPRTVFGNGVAAVTNEYDAPCKLYDAIKVSPSAADSGLYDAIEVAFGDEYTPQDVFCFESSPVASLRQEDGVLLSQIAGNEIFAKIVKGRLFHSTCVTQRLTSSLVVDDNKVVIQFLPGHGESEEVMAVIQNIRFANKSPAPKIGVRCIRATVFAQGSSQTLEACVTVEAAEAPTILRVKATKKSFCLCDCDAGTDRNALHPFTFIFSDCSLRNADTNYFTGGFSDVRITNPHKNDVIALASSSIVNTMEVLLKERIGDSTRPPENLTSAADDEGSIQVSQNGSISFAGNVVAQVEHGVVAHIVSGESPFTRIGGKEGDSMNTLRVTLLPHCHIAAVEALLRTVIFFTSLSSNEKFTPSTRHIRLNVAIGPSEGKVNEDGIVVIPYHHPSSIDPKELRAHSAIVNVAILPKLLQTSASAEPIAYKSGNCRLGAIELAREIDELSKSMLSLEMIPRMPGDVFTISSHEFDVSKTVVGSSPQASPSMRSLVTAMSVVAKSPRRTPRAFQSELSLRPFQSQSFGSRSPREVGFSRDGDAKKFSRQSPFESTLSPADSFGKSPKTGEPSSPHAIANFAPVLDCSPPQEHVSFSGSAALYHPMPSIHAPQARDRRASVISVESETFSDSDGEEPSSSHIKRGQKGEIALSQDFHQELQQRLFALYAVHAEKDRSQRLAQGMDSRFDVEEGIVSSSVLTKERRLFAKFDADIGKISFSIRSASRPEINQFLRSIMFCNYGDFSAGSRTIRVVLTDGISSFSSVFLPIIFESPKERIPAVVLLSNKAYLRLSGESWQAAQVGHFCVAPLGRAMLSHPDVIEGRAIDALDCRVMNETTLRVSIADATPGDRLEFLSVDGQHRQLARWLSDKEERNRQGAQSFNRFAPLIPAEFHVVIDNSSNLVAHVGDTEVVFGEVSSDEPTTFCFAFKKSVDLHWAAYCLSCVTFIQSPDSKPGEKNILFQYGDRQGVTSSTFLTIFLLPALFHVTSDHPTASFEKVDLSGTQRAEEVVHAMTASVGQFLTAQQVLTFHVAKISVSLINGSPSEVLAIEKACAVKITRGTVSYHGQQCARAMRSRTFIRMQCFEQFTPQILQEFLSAIVVRDEVQSEERELLRTPPQSSERRPTTVYQLHLNLPQSLVRVEVSDGLDLPTTCDVYLKR